MISKCSLIYFKYQGTRDRAKNLRLGVKKIFWGSRVIPKSNVANRRLCYWGSLRSHPRTPPIATWAAPQPASQGAGESGVGQLATRDSCQQGALQDVPGGQWKVELVQLSARVYGMLKMRKEEKKYFNISLMVRNQFGFDLKLEFRLNFIFPHIPEFFNFWAGLSSFVNGKKLNAVSHYCKVLFWGACGEERRDFQEDSGILWETFQGENHTAELMWSILRW